MAHKVFISYRNSDGKHFAKNIYETLKKCGFQPFYSEREFRGGDEFPTELEEKVQNCDVFILALTPGVYAGFLDHPREKDYVFQEIKTALKYNKVIIPFKDGEAISFTESDFPEELNNIQTIDGRIRKIGDQHALVYHNDLEDPFRQLVKDIKKHVTKGKRNKYALRSSLVLIVLVALLVGLFLWKPWEYNTPYAEDKTAPTVYISSFIGTTIKDGYIKQGESISFTVEFSDNIGVKEIDLLPDSILLSPGLIADIEISGSGNTRMISLNNISGTYGDHYVTIPANVARDAAGNHNFALKSSSFNLQGVDSTIPTINIARPTFDNGAISFVVYTDGNVQLQKLEIDPLDISTHGFIGDIEVRGEGNSNREIIITNCKPIGSECYIEIAEGVAVDTAGNKSKSVRSHSFDISKPALTISAPSKENVTAGESVSYTIATADNVQVTYFGIHKDDINMVGFTADVEIVEKDDFVRQIVFSNVQSTSTGIKYFVIAEGVAKDALGNGNSSKNSPAFEIE